MENHNSHVSKLLESSSPSASTSELFQEYQFLTSSVIRQLYQHFHISFIAFKENFHLYNENSFSRMKFISETSSRYFSFLCFACQKLEKDSTEFQIFFSLSKIWYLCEQLFTIPPAGARAGPHLAKWLEVCFSEEEKEKDLLTRFKLLTLRGAKREALKLLNKERLTFDASQHEIICELFSEMPEWFTDWSKRVDFAHYEKWKERCYSELLRAGEQESYYVSVLKILSGDELEIKRNSLHWYYMIVGDLCYVDCTVKFTELDQFVPRWQADASDSLNTFDFLVTAALKNEPFEVLRLCQEYGNTWFTAHLFDLIITSGHSSVVAEGKALREDLLVAYANVLLRDNSYGMWQIGADYLKYCGEKGKVEFRNHVDALAQSHQLKVRKVLELCLYFGLVEKYNAICLFHGNTALKNNHFCSALRWFWKGHWQDHVVKVIDQLMDESDKSFEAANRIHGMFAVLSEKDFRCFPRLKILEHYCALNMILYE
jgi:hypothetical protein